MANILYESGSIREDHGVLVLKELQPQSVPIYFEVLQKDDKGNDYNVEIPKDHIIVVTIKQNINYAQNILKYTYTGLVNNTITLKISAKEIKLLRANKTYYLGAVEYDITNTPVRTLINVLPIKVEASATR